MATKGINSIYYKEEEFDLHGSACFGVRKQNQRQNADTMQQTYTKIHKKRRNLTGKCI